MRKVRFRAGFLVLFILLLPIQGAMAQSELNSKVEELGDKLTASTTGEVMAVEGEIIYVNLGEKDSICEGSEFEVVRLGEVIMAGNKAHHKERSIGEVQITKVRKEMSLAKTTTAFAKIEKGDRIYQKRKKVTRITLTEFPYKDSTNDLTRNVYESLSTGFIRKGLQVVERSQLDRVFREQKISYSGLIDISTAQKLGQMLGTEAVLLGSVTDSGNNVVVRARLVDVGKGVAMTAAEVEITKNPEIQTLLRTGTGGKGQTTSGDTPIFFTGEGSQQQEKGVLFSGQPKTTEDFTIKLHSKEIGEAGDLRLNFLITTKSNVNFSTRMDEIYLGDDLGNIYPVLKSSNTQMDCVAGVPRRFVLGFEKYPHSPMNLVLGIHAGRNHLLTARVDQQDMTAQWK